MGAAPRQRGNSEAWRFQAPKARRREYGRWQDQAIGDDDRRVGPERREAIRDTFILQAPRCTDLEVPCLGGSLHRREASLLSPPRPAWRLRVNGNDGVTRIEQGVEDRHGEIRGPHEDQPEGLHDQALLRACCFFALASLRRMTLRRTADK